MPYVEIVEERHYTCWRISRPERGNAVGTSIADELAAALAKIRSCKTMPRALVVTAAPLVTGGKRLWVAGGDLRELAALPGRDDGRRYAAAVAGVLRGLDELPCPVLVALDGDAIGGGAELAIAGDLRLATAASRLVFKQLEVGLATGYGSARRLVELVGLARAQELLFGCRTLTANEAKACGLVHEVVPAEAELWQRIGEITARWAELAPEALAAQKRMLWHAVRGHPGAAAAAELDEFTRIWGNPAHRQFLAGFSRGRGP